MMTTIQSKSGLEIKRVNGNMFNMCVSGMNHVIIKYPSQQSLVSSSAA